MFTHCSVFDAGARDLFAWHATPGALRCLIPPWERVEVERAPASLADGQTAVLVMRLGPLRLRWVALHRGFVDRGEEGGEFTDVQVSGPFSAWEHRHIVRSKGPGRSELEDRIEYTLPLGWLGELVAGAHVRRKLVRMFEFRHRATMDALAAARSGA